MVINYGSKPPTRHFSGKSPTVTQDDQWVPWKELTEPLEDSGTISRSANPHKHQENPHKNEDNPHNNGENRPKNGGKSWENPL